MEYSSNSVDCEFLAGAWLQKPFKFNESILPVNPELAELGYIQAVSERMASNAIIFREAGSKPNKQMLRLERPDFSNFSLAQQLSSTARSLMLTDVHLSDSGYAEVLNEFIQWLSSSLGLSGNSILRPSASLFLSSPDAISCYHTDREHNILMQLAGHKCIHVFPPRTTLPTELTSALFRKRKGIHFEYETAMEEEGTIFELNKDNALYLPRLWPHWVANGSQISVSLSLNFFTPKSFAIEKLYGLSDRIRSLLK